MDRAGSSTASADEFARLDAHRRAANYLSVGQTSPLDIRSCAIRCARNTSGSGPASEMVDQRGRPEMGKEKRLGVGTGRLSAVERRCGLKSAEVS
jgi:hypothetical protein